MKRWTLPALLGLALGALIGAQPAGQTQRELLCYALVQDSGSSEARNLYLQRMGFGPEALRTFAPSRFERGPGGFTCHTEGVFGYEAGTPVEVARSGNVVLYELKVRVRSETPPRIKKTVSVDLKLSELASTGDAVQPGLRAIELAAAKAGWKTGLAWILDMKWRGRGLLRVSVALAP